MKLAKNKPSIITHILLPVVAIAFFAVTLYPDRITYGKNIFLIFWLGVIFLLLLPIKDTIKENISFKNIIKKLLFLLFYAVVFSYNLLMLVPLFANQNEITSESLIQIFPVWGLIILLMMALCLFLYRHKNSLFYSGTFGRLFRLKDDEDVAIFVNFCSRVALLTALTLLAASLIISILQISSQINQIAISPPFSLAVIIIGMLFISPIANSKKSIRALNHLARSALPGMLQYILLFTIIIFLLVFFYYASILLADFFPGLKQPVIAISSFTNEIYQDIFQIVAAVAFTILASAIFSYQLRILTLKKQLLLGLMIVLIANAIVLALYRIPSMEWQKGILGVLNGICLLSLLRNRWLWYLSRGIMPGIGVQRSAKPFNLLKGIAQYTTSVVLFYYMAGIPVVAGILFLLILPTFYCYCFSVCAMFVELFPKKHR